MCNEAYTSLAPMTSFALYAGIVILRKHVDTSESCVFFHTVFNVHVYYDTLECKVLQVSHNLV